MGEEPARMTMNEPATTEVLRGRIAQQQLNLIDAASCAGGGRERAGEGLHPEVLRGIRRVGPVEPVEERGDLEQPRAVLDEVLIDEFAGRQWRCAVHDDPLQGVLRGRGPAGFRHCAS